MRGQPGTTCSCAQSQEIGTFPECGILWFGFGTPQSSAPGFAPHGGWVQLGCSVDPTPDPLNCSCPSKNAPEGPLWLEGSEMRPG